MFWIEIDKQRFFFNFFFVSRLHLCSALSINNNIALNKINKQNEEDKHDVANGGVVYNDGVNNANNNTTTNNNNGVFDNSSDNSPWDSKTNLHKYFFYLNMTIFW